MNEVGFCPVVSGVSSSGVLSCGVLSVWGFVLWGFVRTPFDNTRRIGVKSLVEVFQMSS